MKFITEKKRWLMAESKLCNNEIRPREVEDILDYYVFLCAVRKKREGRR